MMTTRVLITVHSAIYALFALALFFLPGTLWPNYGVQTNDQYGWFLSQHNSIFLGGIAAMGFLFRDAPPGSAVERKILLTLLITSLLGAAVTFYACFKGIFTGFGWSDPIFFSLLSVLIAVRLSDSNRFLED